MKAKKLETIISDFNSPEVLSIKYNFEKLEIEYSANEKDEYWIRFDNPIAFKCMEERDMLNYWEHKVLTENWILEILEGGWMEMEKSRGGFISDKMFELKEILIEGIDDCVSVLSFDYPKIESKNKSSK